jgi:protein-S-isoprenylcysteine O-methyltransferase Ste14
MRVPITMRDTDSTTVRPVPERSRPTSSTLPAAEPASSMSITTASRAHRDPRPRTSFAGRAASLVYGATAYIAFLVTFLYAIGFVSGFLVPKTVDDGVSVPIAEALLVNGGFLALFAVQHTIMARRAFKRRWTRIVPQQIERSTFVLATCVILGGLFWQWRHMPGTVWQVEGAFAYGLHTVAFAGWGVVLLSSFLIDHFELFGLRQVVRHFRQLPPEPPHFRERSLYRHVRHPLMLGFLLAFWATPVMTMGHFFFAAMCTGYILFGVQVEERSLVAEHGDSYRDYRRRVPMLLPLPRRAR